MKYVDESSGENEQVVIKDWQYINAIEWKGIIMDEAHRMKNIQSKFLQCISNIKAEYRLLLTGTPLQNNTLELFPLLNFIKVFTDQRLFVEQFGNLKTGEQVQSLQGDGYEQVEKLRSLLSPFMLRRVKEDVEQSIPIKQETIIEVELTKIQKQYYRYNLAFSVDVIEPFMIVIDRSFIRAARVEICPP